MHSICTVHDARRCSNVPGTLPVLATSLGSGLPWGFLQSRLLLSFEGHAELGGHPMDKEVMHGKRKEGSIYLFRNILYRYTFSLSAFYAYHHNLGRYIKKGLLLITMIFHNRFYRQPGSV